MEIKFERSSFSKRLRSMLRVDLRRMFTMPFLYIMVGICLVIPVLILVMTTMMDGTTTVNPQTNIETTMQGFENTWQIIGTTSKDSSSMDMSLTGMCNINMLYFFVAVLVCVFVAGDFRSGYAKNLFTVRAKKSDYVISKTLACFVGGVLMLVAFFLGAMLGGAVSSLSFDAGIAGAYGIAMCLLSKLFLVGVFVPIFVLVSVIGKQRLWLSVILSLGVGMLLFNMVPTISPLDSTILNVVLSLVGASVFSVGMGAISNIVLKKTSLI